MYTPRGKKKKAYRWAKNNTQLPKKKARMANE